METLTDEQILHDWVIRQIKLKYSRTYSEVKINCGEKKENEYKGHYPDVLFINYGQVTHIVEVETQNSINQERAEHWKGLSDLGAKLVVIVPKRSQKTAMELCWGNSLAGKVEIGTFDFLIDI